MAFPAPCAQRAEVPEILRVILCTLVLVKQVNLVPGDGVVADLSEVVERSIAACRLRQYLHFCTSKASKVST